MNVSSPQSCKHQAQCHLCIFVPIVLHLLRHPPHCTCSNLTAGGRLSALCCQPEAAMWPGNRRLSARPGEGEAMLRPILGSAAAVIHSCACCLAKECPQNPPSSRHPTNGAQRGSCSCELSTTSPPPCPPLFYPIYHPNLAAGSGGSILTSAEPSPWVTRYCCQLPTGVEDPRPAQAAGRPPRSCSGTICPQCCSTRSESGPDRARDPSSLGALHHPWAPREGIPTHQRQEPVGGS